MGRKKATPAPETQDGYNAFGQLEGTEGTPDTEAVAEVEAANSGLEPVVPQPEPEVLQPVDQPMGEPPMSVDLSEALGSLQTALGSPEGVRMLADAVTQNPGLRDLLQIPAGRGAPSGHYRRNYEAEKALQVHGGVEVAHEPGFVPLPPSYIPRYKDAKGGKTDHIMEAQRDSQGNPELTVEYKAWLDAQMEGGRLSGAAKTDIEVGQFVADDTGVEVRATG